jgi:hypothetical protein
MKKKKASTTWRDFCFVLEHVLVVLKILKWQVLRTLKSVSNHWQAAQKTERKSESEIAMCDRMQMYNIMYLEICCANYPGFFNIYGIHFPFAMDNLDVGWLVNSEVKGMWGRKQFWNINIFQAVKALILDGRSPCWDSELPCLKYKSKAKQFKQRSITFLFVNVLFFNPL